jgi:hypothetical protein
MKMKVTKGILGFLAVAVLLTACDKKAAMESGLNFTAPVVADEIAEPTSMEKALNTVDPTTTPKKIIKNGSLNFETNNLAETAAFVKKTVAHFGGYISSESSSNYDKTNSNQMSVKVPSARFDSLLDCLVQNSNVQKIENKSVYITDVTQEYVDVETRLNIKKESYKKLMALFDRAKTVSEILEVQKQLTDLQTEIESAEGQMKYLNHQIDYSTLEVSFSKKESSPSHFFRDFGKGLSSGWGLFLNLLTLLANLWVILLVGVSILVFFRIRKKNKLNKTK